MGGSGHWAGMELQAELRHADDLAAAAHRRLLRAAGLGARGERVGWLVRALDAAGTAAAGMRARWRRPAEVPAPVETIPQPAGGLLLD